MQKIFKRTAAAIMAAASLAVTMIGTSASAVTYPTTSSTVLKNISGEYGNKTTDKLTIVSKDGIGNYTTSYDFAHRTNAVLTVSTVNALTNKSVKLNKDKRSTVLYAEARYSYITFEGKLTNSDGESGIWSVS